MDKLWERVISGRHTAVIGPLPEAPGSPALCLVRVRCDVPQQVLGPVLEAQRKAEAILGAALPLGDRLSRQAAERVLGGLRRRLLGELGEPGLGAAAVASWNRLGRESERPCAVVFERVDRADGATLTLLREILHRRGWLAVPLVLALDEKDGAAAPLLQELRAIDGDAAVLEREAPEQGAGADAAASGRALPPEVLRVLRAGALIGSGFEAELVAALLGLGELAVLEQLQLAADAGIPIEDRGEGRFYLPEVLVAALRGSILPSLSLAWHRRLGELLAPPEALRTEASPALGRRRVEVAGPAAEAESTEAAVPAAAKSAEAAGSAAAKSAEAAGPVEAKPAQTTEETGARPAQQTERAATPDAEAQVFAAAEPELEAPLHWPFPEPQAGAAEEREAGAEAHQTGPAEAREAGAAEAREAGAAEAPRPAAPSAAPPAPATRPASTTSAPWRPDGETRRAQGPAGEAAAASSLASDARAAAHLVAAGQIEAGAERLLAAAQQAAEAGAYPQALAYVGEVLRLLDPLPRSPRRRVLRAAALLSLGRLQWLASGPGLSFTLDDALASVEAAGRLLQPEDPLPLRAEVATVLASVYYDMGDLRSLERSLDELSEMSRALHAAGDARGAARLLNDQAAVYVRLGDPVRAWHLLEESRRLFERRAASDPEALRELAETYHLMARIPLHVRARPGRDADAVAMGRDRARAAEAAYRQLGASRELWRVRETLGQLELRAGRLEHAARHLTAAAEAQQRGGDALGLARTTAALAEVLRRTGQVSQGLGLLGESVALNLEKGSPIGLAYNRRCLEGFAESLPPEEAAWTALRQVEAQLGEAEDALGRIKLPGEADT